MTIDDTYILKTAVAWIASAAAALSGGVTYLFYQVVSLTKKLGALEQEVSEAKLDLLKFQNCPIQNCVFRPSFPHLKQHYDNPSS